MPSYNLNKCWTGREIVHQPKPRRLRACWLHERLSQRACDVTARGISRISHPPPPRWPLQRKLPMNASWRSSISIWRHSKVRHCFDVVPLLSTHRDCQHTGTVNTQRLSTHRDNLLTCKLHVHFCVINGLTPLILVQVLTKIPNFDVDLNDFDDAVILAPELTLNPVNTR